MVRTRDVSRVNGWSLEIYVAIEVLRSNLCKRCLGDDAITHHTTFENLTP